MDPETVVAQATPAQGGAKLERRLEELDQAVARVQEIQVRLEQSETQFRRVTQDCGGLLQGIATLDQLEELNKRLGRMVDEAALRMESFEKGVSREWHALRQLYEEPLQTFRQQALELRQLSLEVARSASLSRRLADGSFDVVAARESPGSVPSTQAAIEPFALSDVARLHQEARSVQEAAVSPGRLSDRVRTALGEGAPRQASASETVTSGPAPPFQRTARWWLTLATLVIGAVAVGGYTLRLRDRIIYLESQSQAASQQIVAAERQTEQVRDLAERQLTEAQRTAARAQTVAEILASPDLLRVELVGRARAPNASAQALWSRSRGFVLTASQLPPVPSGSVYQVWALSQGRTISVGVFERDESGRCSLIVDKPMRLPSPLVLFVSLEADTGSAKLSGPVYMGPPRIAEE